jgi:hypothetical protein
MDKINSFIVVSVADNLSKMTPTELKMVAELLVDSTNASRLSDYLSFYIQDKMLSEIEVQDPVY